MTANIVTFTGEPKRLGLPTTPKSKLHTCEIEIANRQLAPINNCMAALETYMIAVQTESQRLLALLGGDQEEWFDRMGEIERKVMGHD